MSQVFFWLYNHEWSCNQSTSLGHESLMFAERKIPTLQVLLTLKPQSIPSLRLSCFSRHRGWGQNMRGRISLLYEEGYAFQLHLSHQTLPTQRSSWPLWTFLLRRPFTFTNETVDYCSHSSSNSFREEKWRGRGAVRVTMTTMTQTVAALQEKGLHLLKPTLTYLNSLPSPTLVKTKRQKSETTHRISSSQ